AAGRGGPGPAAGVGDTGELQRPDDVIFPLRHAAHALAEIEDEIGAAAGVEPPHVMPDGDAVHLMAERAEDPCDVIDRLHHAGDVVGGPIIGAGVVEDDDPHADAWMDASCRGTTCRAPTSCALIRFQAIRTTS